MQGELIRECERYLAGFNATKLQTCGVFISSYEPGIRTIAKNTVQGNIYAGVDAVNVNS